MKGDKATDKPIRVFGVPWHVSHNYALISIPNTEWGLLNNNVRSWNLSARPLPKNAKWVPYFEKGKYDLAIIHVDQQCVDPRIGKGKLYRCLNETIQGIPKIVINHGTPFFPENWESTPHKSWSYPSGFDDSSQDKCLEHQKKFLIEGGLTVIGDEITEIEGMEKLIGKNKMIVNSFKAREQWGWGKTIWHGLDAKEWWDLPKEPRSVTQVSPGGLEYYYGRLFLRKTMERLKNDYGLRHVWMSNPRSWTPDRHPLFDEKGGFFAYRDFLGRSLVYFNPTKESPMPRSRTEAMLSGCCMLTTPHQDADKFINFDCRKIWENSGGIKDFIDKIDPFLYDEINGIIVPENPLAVSALINHLIYNRFNEALKIGQRGKKTAREIFSKSRYDRQWTEYIAKVLSKEEK